MVLNSVTWDTELLISIDGVLTKTTIGGVHGRAWRARRARPTWRRTHRYALAWIKDRDVHRLHRRGGRALDAGRGVHAPPGRQRGRQQHGVQTVRSGAEVTVTRGKACSSASATRSCTPPWTTSSETIPWPPPCSRT
jgi:hypothetical protein